jgi:hypothetical protein
VNLKGRKMKIRYSSISVLLLAAMMLLAACSSTTNQQSNVPGSIDQAVLTITLNNGSFSPSVVSFKQGEEVRLTLYNAGFKEQSWEFKEAGTQQVYATAVVPPYKFVEVSFTAPIKETSYVSTCPVVSETKSTC